MNKEYQKIETVFNRETFGKNRLIPYDWRNATVKDLKDIMWVGTEKIDGTNIRVYWDGHKVSYAGRTDKAQIPKHLLKYLEDTFSGNEKEEVFEQMFGEKEVILYGEGYGAKIQNGGLYRNDVSFILFDVMIDGYYLDFANVMNIAKTLGIDCVPIVYSGSLESLIEYVSEGHLSTIGKAPMEGVVARPLHTIYDKRGNRIIVKIKYCDFKDWGHETCTTGWLKEGE